MFFDVDLVPGITLGDESATAVATEPPAVVGQAPVGCTPGGDFLRGQEDDGDQDKQEHEKLEHFRFCVFESGKSKSYEIINSETFRMA